MSPPTPTVLLWPEGPCGPAGGRRCPAFLPDTASLCFKGKSAKCTGPQAHGSASAHPLRGHQGVPSGESVAFTSSRPSAGPARRPAADRSSCSLLKRDHFESELNLPSHCALFYLPNKWTRGIFGRCRRARPTRDPRRGPRAAARPRCQTRLFFCSSWKRPSRQLRGHGRLTRAARPVWRVPQLRESNTRGTDQDTVSV